MFEFLPERKYTEFYDKNMFTALSQGCTAASNPGNTALLKEELFNSIPTNFGRKQILILNTPQNP